MGLGMGTSKWGCKEARADMCFQTSVVAGPSAGILASVKTVDVLKTDIRRLAMMQAFVTTGVDFLNI